MEAITGFMLSCNDFVAGALTPLLSRCCYSLQTFHLFSITSSRYKTSCLFIRLEAISTQPPKFHLEFILLPVYLPDIAINKLLVANLHNNSSQHIGPDFARLLGKEFTISSKLFLSFLPLVLSSSRYDCQHCVPSITKQILNRFYLFNKNHIHSANRLCRQTGSDSTSVSPNGQADHPNQRDKNSSAKPFKSSRLGRDLRVALLRGATSRKVYIHNYLTNLMKMDPQIEVILEPLRKDVKEHGDLVRSLKAQNAPKVDIDTAVRMLKEKKRILEAKEASLVPKDSFVDKSRLEDVLKRRFFYDLSFSIYGGVSGLFDYGPPGVALKKNILRLWESHFVLEDDLLEIEASQLTLEPVLKASGHVERFADLMVKDTKTGDCYRLDHLIKSHLEKLESDKNCPADKKRQIQEDLTKLDGKTLEELKDMVLSYGMKAPATDNDLSDPIEFNLMFATSIGPEGLVKSYLRPETAQGIFVNFKRLLEANSGKLPFGVAQIGKSFRNEISPRGGLIRMREFTMGEIEYFVDPQNKKHAKFDSIKHMSLNLYSACNQMDGQPAKLTTLEEAVKSGTVANEVLAYYLARINLFMHRIGMSPDKIRFRQHMGNEMAHYATDCWDCELLTTSGWLECVGCADRSCYDLTQHANATNNKLSASRPLKTPKEVDVAEFVFQKSVLGRALKGYAQAVMDKLNKADDEQLQQYEKDLEADGIKVTLESGANPVVITKDMASIKRSKKTVHVEEVVPSVIEPSFGIDRIMYTLMEHNFKIREDNQLRSFFSFPAIVAPTKCSLLPLSNNEEFYPFVYSIMDNLKREGVKHKLDSSGESIGKRYARTDEIGIPYGITVDFDTIKENSVTLRHCTTMEQIRVDITAIAALVRDLSNGSMEWTEARKLWPEFKGQSDTIGKSDN